MKDSSNTINSLAHTKWNCKYHREECESDTRICGKPAKNGQGSRPVKYL